MNKIAFVIPWYGLGISGGAEAACRNLAERLALSGEQVEIITTCVQQFNSDWNKNYYSPGEERLNGVLVKRFKVRKRNTKKFDEINLKLMNGQIISSEEEQVFLQEMVNSSDLENYLKNNKNDYKKIIFTPYMFGVTYHGIQQVLDKAILLPAFHDESYAYFKSFKDVYSKVKGMIFFSEMERDWAEKNYDLSNVDKEVLGLGIEPFTYNAQSFCEKYNIQEYSYILYAGRKDAGKKVDELITYFREYVLKNNSDLKLVLIGGGTIEIPSDMKDSIIDLGFVDEQDKYDAYSGALVFINPSLYESFSIVIMESWFTGRPVIVNEKCEVTKNFSEQSNGGLYYANLKEFCAVVDLIKEQKLLSNKLGENGQKFVNTKFVWEKVIDGYKQFINKE